jgi:hypothetical protein
LLSEEVTAVGNSAVERDCRKVRAAFTLLLGPFCNGRNRLPRYPAKDVEQTIVSADGADFATVISSFWA